VTLETSTPEIKERETRSLNAIKDNFPKTIITLHRYPAKNINGIRVAALADFLLEDF